MQQLNKNKKTESAGIPDSWSFKKIGELLAENYILEIQDGNHGELHPKFADFTEKGIPFLTANSITNNRISFNKCKYLPQPWLKKLRIGFARENDVILTHKGTLGLCALVPMGTKNVILSPQTTYYRLSPKIHSTFLFYFFQTSFFQNQLFQMGRQSTRDYVGITSQRSLVIVLPTIQEQQKIASILLALDELIQKTDHIIEKTQNLKKGLTQRLLTKGIGHTRFKKTELGDVPENWDVDEIQKHSKITTGAKNTQDKIEDGSYPFFVRSQKIERINTYSFDGEAVLTAGDGVGTGKVFHYINGKFDFHQRVYKISNFSDRLLGYFFYLYFSNYFLPRIMSMSAKASVDSVRMDMIAEIKIPLPEKDEQIAIVNVLRDVNSEIEELLKKREKYIKLKKGIMQKLMTGKIRLK